MPIAYAEPDEMQDEEQDLEPGMPIQPQPPVASIPAPAVPPVQPPPTAGAIPRSMRPPVNQAPGGFNMELWREQNAQLPMAKAEEAVGSALRFQAVRQYQADIAAGKSPAEALARSAPLMFYGPKNTLSGAAQFMRATAPPQTKYQDIGGVLYEIVPGQRPVPIPPRGVSQKLDPVEQGFLKQDLLKLKEIEDDPAFSMPNAKGEDLRRRAHDIRNKITIQYRRRTPTEAIPPVPLPGAPQPPTPTAIAPGVTTPPAIPAPPVAAAPAPAPSTPTITTKEQFDRLPSGTIYVGKNGRRYRKP